MSGVNYMSGRNQVFKNLRDASPAEGVLCRGTQLRMSMQVHSRTRRKACQPEAEDVARGWIKEERTPDTVNHIK